MNLEHNKNEIMGSQRIIELLNKEWNEIQFRRPGFSLRSFAKHLDLSSALLSEVMSGKRKITRNLAFKFCQVLSLDPQTSKQILDTYPAKQVRKKRGPNLEIQNFVQLSSDQFKIVAEWYCYAILSLAEIKGFKSDVTWIANRLGIMEREAKSGLESLVRLGLLISDENGNLKASGQQLITTNDIPDSSIKKNHRQGMELAIKALHDLDTDSREFQAFTVVSDPKKLKEAKEKIRRMKLELVRFLESGEKKEVYRINLQLFPVSK